ncbi:isochorismate synthase [Heyndrickxia camelliae]|nr:isochorismate synthase [Heyndrickxia camelliae]
MKYLDKQFEMSLKQAKEINKTILFSYTEKVALPHPLPTYSSVIRNSEDYFYWKDPQNETIIIGIGNVLQIVSEQIDERFHLVEEKWDNILENAFIYDSANQSGTGPLLFGGFTFDPNNRKKPEWETFSHATFFVPEIMITLKEKESFLTLNVMVNPENDTTILEHLKKQMMNILNRKEQTSDLLPAIIEQEEMNPKGWKESVSKVVSLLKDGYLDKVVLARKMRIKFQQKVVPEVLLNHLLEQQKGSYVFSFGLDNDSFAGASPERLVKKIGENVLSTCLAGSIKRSGDANQDQALGKILLEDKKNRHEHQLVVSMIADVFREHCREVDIPDEPTLMKTPDIQHLYTPVKGKVKENTSILHLVESLHPTPALGGTPRQDAMKVIRDVENMDRGLYAGPIGWMDYRGNGEFIVAIRSGLIKGNEAFIYAGCGIVADSNPEDEYLETKIKFRPMLRALGGKEDE